MLWECHRGILYYIYYALFIYFIIVWIRKIRYFLSVKDPIDKLISDYFYNNEIPYLKIKALRENNDIMKIYFNVGKDTKNMLEYKEEIISYFLNDFVIYHMRYPVRKMNEKYLNNNARRTNILILLSLGIIYYYQNSSKYILIIYTNIPIYLLLVILSLMGYFAYTRILYETETISEESPIVWAENRYYKNLFRIIVFLMAIPMLYIMLKNKLTLLPNEVIFNLGENIRILEIFSLEEKSKYLRNYVEYLQKIVQFDEILLEKIIVNVEKTVSKNTSLETIREEVHKVLFHIKNTKPLTLLELFTHWAKKIKHILTR